MMSVLKKNFLEDFKLVIDLGENYDGEPFALKFWTGKNTRDVFVCSYDGETYSNCVMADTTNVLCLFDNHGLGVGTLYVQITRNVTDAQMPDGVLKLVTAQAVECTDTESTTATVTTDTYLGGGVYYYGTPVTLSAGDVITVTGSQGWNYLISEQDGNLLPLVGSEDSVTYTAEEEVEVYVGSAYSTYEEISYTVTTTGTGTYTIELGRWESDTPEITPTMLALLAPVIKGEDGEPGLTEEEHDALVQATEDANDAATNADTAATSASTAATSANTAAETATDAASTATSAASDATEAAEAANTAASTVADAIALATTATSNANAAASEATAAATQAATDTAAAISAFVDEYQQLTAAEIIRILGIDTANLDPDRKTEWEDGDYKRDTLDGVEYLFRYDAESGAWVQTTLIDEFLRLRYDTTGSAYINVDVRTNLTGGSVVGAVITITNTDTSEVIDTHTITSEDVGDTAYKYTHSVIIERNTPITISVSELSTDWVTPLSKSFVVSLSEQTIVMLYEAFYAGFSVWAYGVNGHEYGEQIALDDWDTSNNTCAEFLIYEWLDSDEVRRSVKVGIGWDKLTKHIWSPQYQSGTYAYPQLYSDFGMGPTNTQNIIEAINKLMDAAEAAGGTVVPSTTDSTYTTAYARNKVYNAAYQCYNKTQAWHDAEGVEHTAHGYLPNRKELQIFYLSGSDLYNQLSAALTMLAGTQPPSYSNINDHIVTSEQSGFTQVWAVRNNAFWAGDYKRVYSCAFAFLDTTY